MARGEDVASVSMDCLNHRSMKGSRFLASTLAPYPDVVTTPETCSGSRELGCEDSVLQTRDIGLSLFAQAVSFVWQGHH